MRGEKDGECHATKVFGLTFTCHYRVSTKTPRPPGAHITLISLFSVDVFCYISTIIKGEKPFSPFLFGVASVCFSCCSHSSP